MSSPAEFRADLIEQAAKAISGAPFPSQRSMLKAAAAVAAILPAIADVWDRGWRRGCVDRSLGRTMDGYIEIDPTPNPYRTLIQELGESNG